MNYQLAIVVVIVVLAALFVAWKTIATLHGKKTGACSGCACGPADRPDQRPIAQHRAPQLIPLPRLRSGSVRIPKRSELGSDS